MSLFFHNGWTIKSLQMGDEDGILHTAVPSRGPFGVKNGRLPGQQQQKEGDPKVLATTPWVKTGIQVAQNDRGAKVHHHKQVSLHFEPSSPFYGRFSVQKWLFFEPFSGRSS